MCRLIETLIRVCTRCSYILTLAFANALANACDVRYRFRRSALEDALKACNVGDINVVLQILQDLELVFSVHGSDGADASADALYAVPGRLAHNDAEVSVKLFETMRAKAFLGATRGCHHVGVRLRITNSSLMLPPSTFSQLLHRLSSAPGFEIWQRGARTTRELTGGGHVSIEGLIDLDDSLQFIDVVARSETEGYAALRLCVDHLRHVVATCEAVCAESVIRFEAKVIMPTPLKYDGTREVCSGPAPRLPARVTETGLSQPQWVVQGLLPAHAGTLESILNTATATYSAAVENRAGIAAVHADVRTVVGKLDALQLNLSKTLERHHTASDVRLGAIARAIAEAADDARLHTAGQDVIVSRLSACVGSLREVRDHVAAGFRGCEDRDGAVAEELSAVRHALHDKMSDDEATQARDSKAFARIDRKLGELLNTIERSHTVSEAHLDAITRASAAAAKARSLGEIDLAAKLDDCRGQLAELYRAVSVGDVRDDERNTALQQAVDAITRAVEASSSDFQETVVSAASGIKSFSLSLTEHRVPSVFVVLPDTLHGRGAVGVLKSAAALLRDPVAFFRDRLVGVARLRLVCMRTWEPVPCGEDGLGYKIDVGSVGVHGDDLARCLATLMRGTLVTARVFNVGASLARLFGIPAPKVPTDALKDLIEAIVAGENTPEFVKSDGDRKQLWGERMRQYEKWLAEADSDRTWGGLERELDDESNTVRWVLPATRQIWVSDLTASAASQQLQDGTESTARVGGIDDGSKDAVVHQGNVFIKETATFGHPWRSRFWRVTRNSVDGGWLVRQWQRAADDASSLQGPPSVVIRVPLVSSSGWFGSVTVCQDDREFMKRKRGKHRGVLKLALVANSKGDRHITFKADVGSTAEADVEAAAKAWRIAFAS
jgi:hypothetical protein